MKTASFASPRYRGFSLIEMAVVLVIIALLLSGGMAIFSTQQEMQKIQETNAILESTRDALIGYAAVNGRLPRPATSGTDGAENPALCVDDDTCSGLIPWTTLGIPKLDAWGKIIRYSVTPAFANATFGLATVGNRKVLTRDGAGATSYLIGLAGLCTTASPCAPAVVFSHGVERHGTTDTGVAIPTDTATNLDEDANNVGPTDYFQRTQTVLTTATGGEFDDLVIWISPNILFNRMLAAGKLPN